MSTLTVGTIAEKVTDAGVSVDGVTLKDRGATFTSAVGVTGNTTITSGNLVIGTSGNGIDFSATSDASGVTSGGEVLDDYEEGTFTPAFDFVSASPSAGATVGEGLYTKIGRLVTVHVRLVNVNSTGATGDVTITGMPFTSKLDGGGDGSVTLFNGTCRINDVNIAASTYVVAEMLDNVAVARLIECTDNATIDLINAGNLNHGTSDFHFTLTAPTA